MDLELTDTNKRATISYYRIRQFFIERIKDSCEFDDSNHIPWVRGWFGDVFGTIEIYKHSILIIPEAAYGYSYFARKSKMVPKKSLPRPISILFEEVPLQILAQIVETIDLLAWPRVNTTPLTNTCMYCGRTDKNMVPRMIEGCKTPANGPTESTGWKQGSFRKTYRDNYGTIGSEINCCSCVGSNAKGVHLVNNMKDRLSKYIENEFEAEIDKAVHHTA